MFEHQKFIDQNLSQYRVSKLIGKGGMSAVYLADDTHLERQVAIKIINLDEAGNSVNDGLIEARNQAKLNHPNIVHVYQLIEDGNQIALVMEYLDGQSLAQYLKEHTASFEQKLEWLMHLTQALAHVHQQNIVHCDLKLANVLLTDNKQIKLLDFGLSKLKRHHQTDKQQSSSFGSQTIMSPEQLKGMEIDFRSDLFSLGIIAFELFSGLHPFGSGTNQQIAIRICTLEAMNANLIAPAIAPPLAELINQLLSKTPTGRPNNTQLVAEHLKQLLISSTQQSILAEQTTPIEPSSIIQTSLSPTTTKISTQPEPQAQLSQALLSKGKLAAAVLVITALLTATVWLQPWQDKQLDNRTVAILPPVFSATNDMAKIQQDMVRNTIDDAIRQRILHTPQMHLINFQQTAKHADNLNQLAKATGASDIVTTDLDCNSQRCNVTFSHLNGENWTVTQRKQWAVVVDNFPSIYNQSQFQFGSFFPNYGYEKLANQSPKDEDYQAYLKLYWQIINKRNINVEALTQLEQILHSSPYLFAGYRLHRETARHLYSQQQNADYPARLQNLLDSSPPEYRYSVYHAADMFWLYMMLEDYDNAKSQIEVAIERGLDLSTVFELQAYWHRENSRLKEAIILYKQAIALRPSTNLMYQQAITHVWAGEIPNAIERLNKVVNILPDDHDANQLLGSLFMFQGDIENAIKSYEKVINQRSRSMDLSNLAIAYALTGDYQKSLFFATEAVNKNPQHPTWLLNLADAQMTVGKRLEAKINYRQVINLSKDKQSVKSWLERAQAYVHTQQPEQAIKALNQAKKLAPNNGEVAFTAALVYTQLNEPISAIAQVEEALNSNIGAVWFKLPWFNGLCAQLTFIRLMEKNHMAERCQNI